MLNSQNTRNYDAIQIVNPPTFKIVLKLDQLIPPPISFYHKILRIGSPVFILPATYFIKGKRGFLKTKCIILTSKLLI